jgi:hypothetical protein
MPEPLHEDISWLHGLLDEVSPPSPAFQRVRAAAEAIVAGTPGDRPLAEL